MKLYVLGNAERPGVSAEVARWLPFLRDKAEVLLVDLRQEQQLASHPAADLAMVFGGDGAILRAARQMGYRQIPVVGVNLGRLGFLADIHPDAITSCFDKVLEGHFSTTDHLMFECVIETPNQPPTIMLGLNEVVLHASPAMRMVELELHIDDEAVSRFSGDGLIVSSPIGSTAHNLSAGGPILGQEMQGFVVTPICPHTLTHRPLVESAEKVYAIKVCGSSAHASVVVDGQTAVEVTPKHRVVIRKAPVTFRLVKVAGHSYFQTLRDKLRWGTPPSYRGEP